MEDIQELMNKMENSDKEHPTVIIKTYSKEIPTDVMERLNKEISTTINEKLNKEISTAIMQKLDKEISAAVNENLNKEASTTLNQTQEQLARLVIAPPVDCEKPTDYVITSDIQIVKHFDIVYPTDFKFIFETGCLHASLEECSIEVCHLPISTHVVKAVGCMPYGYSLTDGLASSSGCGSSTIDLCYQDYICIDAPRCCYADDLTSGSINKNAEIARDNMETDLQDCSKFVPWIAIAILLPYLNLVLYFSAIKLPDCRLS